MTKMIEVLYDSKDYYIVNKPYDMYINSNDDQEKNTLLHNLDPAISPDSLFFVHRLDYATSGVICLARNKTSCAQASRLFERRRAEKYYLAVVRGNVEGERHEVSYKVGEDTACEDGSNRMCCEMPSPCSEDIGRCRNSRAASTSLLVLERGRYLDQPVTVVLLKPRTGRRHQLRVHCKALGHVILGDYTYSDRQDTEPHRMFLHAFRLVLPLENAEIIVETENVFETDDTFRSKYVCNEITNEFSLDNRKYIYRKIDNDITDDTQSLGSNTTA